MLAESLIDTFIKENKRKDSVMLTVGPSVGEEKTLFQQDWLF